MKRQGLVVIIVLLFTGISVLIPFMKGGHLEYCQWCKSQRIGDSSIPAHKCVVRSRQKVEVCNLTMCAESGPVDTPVDIEGKYDQIEPPDTQNTEKNTRDGSHPDQDEFGGSWFCDLCNENSVEWKENVVFRNGVVELSGSTIIPYTAVGGTASSLIQGGKYPVGATFDKKWPTCNGDDPANGDFNRSGTHPRPDFSGNPNRPHWNPTDNDWNDDEAWFYQDYGERISFNALSNAVKNDGRTNTYSIEVSNSDSGPWTEIVTPGSREYVTTFRFSEVTARYVKAIYTDVSMEVPYSEELEVWSFLAHSPAGFVTSEEIELPSASFLWSVLSLDKNEPPDTHINISIINASSDQAIPGFENITDSHFDITNISADTIRIKAWFHGNGSSTPSLGSWGVEWVRGDTWRDGFTGEGKSQEWINLNFTGKADLIDLNGSGELSSEIIDVPMDKVWSFLHFNRTVPEDAYLNISVHDAGTDEVLLQGSDRADTEYSDLSIINATEHPSIYLHAEFHSEVSISPVLHSWAVNWSVRVHGEEYHFVELVRTIPDILYVTEDTPEPNIVDLADHFYATNSGLHPPTYSLELVSDIENITLHLNGSRLDVISLAENWTGSCYVIANCASTYYDCSRDTNPFNITVAAVDDVPAWKVQPTVLFVKKGSSSRSDYSLDDHVTDAEDDELEFTLSITEPDISVKLDDGNRIVVTHNGNFSGNTNVTATVYEIHNRSRSSAISIPLRVMENTPPAVELLSPQNEAIISDLEMSFFWETTDPDTTPENITFTLFFGADKNPDEYVSGLEKNHISIGNLTDGSTYHWSVIPSDETGTGICSNGPWSFTVDRSAPVPQIGYISPANGAIVNTTNLNLTWQVHNGSGAKMQFEIYFGDSRDILSKIGTTEKRLFPLEKLRENITYYWKVTPIGERILGRSISGVWSFTIKKDFRAVYDVTWSVDVKMLVIKKGITTFSFNLTINNTGNNANTVMIDAVGELGDRILISPARISLPQGESGRVKVTVLMSELESGVYSLILKLSHLGPEEMVNLSMNITGVPQDDPPVISEKDEKENISIFYPILIVIIIGFIILMGLLFISYRRRKRSNEDKVADLNMEIESLKTDIVHIPTRGHVKVTSMPHLLEEEENTDMVHGKEERNTDKVHGKEERNTDKVHEKEDEIEPTDRDTRTNDVSEQEEDSTGGPDVMKDPPRMEGFDISNIFLPKDPTKGSLAKKGVLSLPPANLLTITEEDRKVPIEEVFLMTPTGILLEYYSLERESGIQEDVLASMLSAVTSFIIDSLSMVGKDEVDEGNMSITLGGFSVIMAKGDTLNLVAITSHEKKEEIKEQLEKGVYILEDKFCDVMENWDGDMSKIKGVKPYIESLVKGELNIYMKNKSLASGQTCGSIPLSRVTSSTRSSMSHLKKSTVRNISSPEEPPLPPPPESEEIPPDDVEIIPDDVDIWRWTDPGPDE